MKSTLTSKGQITIPAAVRKRLNLQEGQILEFDETVPYLKATKVVDQKRMRSVLGCRQRQSKNSSAKLLDELRGEVELP